MKFRKNFRICKYIWVKGESVIINFIPFSDAEFFTIMPIGTYEIDTNNKESVYLNDFIDYVRSIAPCKIVDIILSMDNIKIEINSLVITDEIKLFYNFIYQKLKDLEYELRTIINEG